MFFRGVGKRLSLPLVEKSGLISAAICCSMAFSLATVHAQPVLTVNGANANYTTTHVFVDEVANESVPLTIVFQPNAANLTDVETFSNLNRRDRATSDADGDGIEDGILPPSGNLIVAGSDAHYFKAYTMTSIGSGQFQLVLNAQKTGAYRLTARYRVQGNTNWIYYNDFNSQRDHAIVVSPRKARDMVMYELNVLNVESQGTLDTQRSTFVDLWDGPGARAYNATNAKFNLNYVTNLGVNWLWLQPIHPIGIDGRQTDPDNSQPYEVGSPYSVKNFFEVNPLMSKANTRDAAKAEFINFVAAADAAGVNIMLDEPFNHTSFDCELAGSGVYYFANGANPTDEIRNHEARFYSLTNNYCSRAYSATSIAVTPDRGDFGKFPDAHDVFFGHYAALVCQNPADNGNYLNEGDWFDYSIGNGNFDATTRNVWRYFSDYILYWLDQTGCTNGTPANQTFKGIDGLRADFAQGLPPQCWEYIVNKTRSRKWDFVFMAESLDGGAVTYRSNRHFDVLNENILFAMQGATSSTDYRNIFEQRRTSYGQALVLLNNVSHDEQNYVDPFQALIRYGICATVDGAPMIFYGQELGISQTFGFDRYELNFGKTVPHFKKFNSLQPILAPVNRNYGIDQLYGVYAGISAARQASKALRSSNRYFINQTSGSAHSLIHSVVKYETANGAPNFNDVVFAFATLDRDNDQSGSFNVDITQNGSNLFGIKPGRLYNVRNIAAFTGIDPARRTNFLWGSGIYGSNVLSSGMYVLLHRVPANDAGWATAPFEAQYLKLYDVTAPPTPAAPFTPKTYAIGNAATFFWNGVTDAEGGISGYQLYVGTTPGGSNVFSGFVTGTNFTVVGTIGQTLYASVRSINNAGAASSVSPNSTGVQLLDPNGDADGDHMNNSDEDIAGTDPFSSASVLRINSLNKTGDVLSWSSISGKSYQVLIATNVSANFAPLSGTVSATGAQTSFTNHSATNAQTYYRIRVLP